MDKIINNYVGENVTPKKKKRRIKLPKNVVEKDGVWYVRKSITTKEKHFDENGQAFFKSKQQQIWKRCEPQTKERAEQILKDLEAEINATKYGISQPVRNFSEVIDKFIEAEVFEATYDKDGRKISGRRSLDGITTMLEVLRSHFGSFDVQNITVGDIEDLKRIRLKTPIEKLNKPRSLRTVNYELSTLRQVLNFAYRRRWLDRNPFNDAKNIIDVSAENRRKNLWTREEEEKALSLCTGKLLAHLKVAIICFVDGGFRRGELLGAKWTDVNWKQGFILARSYKGKSLSIRPIFMTDRMKEILKWWKKEQQTIDNVTDKSLIIGYHDIKKAWIKIRNEIKRPDLRLHDLRHVFGSRLVFDGKVPLPLVSRALGHSSITTTEIYLNTRNEDLEQIAEALNELNKNRE